MLSCYNGEKYITCQINSILNQKFTENIELVLFIRDDGSTDSTPSIVESFCKSTDNIVFYRESNIGLVASFFELIKRVKEMNRFDYFSLADQDDRWDDDKLQIAISAIENQEGPFLYESATRITDSELNYKKMDVIPKRKVTFYNSAIQNFSAGHTYVFNRDLILLISDDIQCDRIYVHDAFIHNIAVICGNIYFDKEPHNDYRQSNNNVLGASKSKSIFDWAKTRLKRIKNNDAKKYAKQLNYYLDYFGNYLNEDEKKEIIMFFKKQKNVFSRIMYSFRMKFYRQSHFETFIMKMFYIFGGYNI